MFSSFRFCKNFSKKFYPQFCHNYQQLSPTAKLSDWVNHILLHLWWTIVAAILKKFFKVDLGISRTLQPKYRSLGAISIASSTSALVYKLLASRSNLSSYILKFLASKAALAAHELVSAVATDNLSKTETYWGPRNCYRVFTEQAEAEYRLYLL